MTRSTRASISLIALAVSGTLLASCAREPAPSATAPTEADVTEATKALVANGPWPQGDERGMANTLGAGTWMRCGYYLSQPQAHSYELSHVRSNTMPMSPFGKPLEFEATPSVSLPGTRHVFNGELVKGGEPGAQGTQMDALGHFAYYDEAWDGKGEPPVAKAKYYGGLTQADVKPAPNSFLAKLGIEKAPPIITSAVLLDAKAHVGKGAALEPGKLVTAADIDAMIEAQGLKWRGILPGDVVYIYTGWGDTWQDPDTDKAYYTKGPGLAADAAQYLADKKVVLIALDNPFTDAVADGQLAQKAAPPQGMDQGLPFVIHHTNLAVNGVHQIQNANLTQLAADKVWTSCTMVLPLREAGHSGSPVRPVAVGVPHSTAL
jgi:kynurenine formamidase